MNSQSKDRTDRRAAGSLGRSTVVLAVGALALLVVAGVVVWWLTRGDAPEAANLDTATASVSDGEGEAGSSADSGGDTSVAGVEGEWIIDTSIGEFSFGDSTGTFVGFRVTEELQAVGQTEAVGRTPGVSGTITITGESLTAASIEADMAAVTTDDSRRDNRVRGALETDQFPTATFVLTSPVELGSGAAAGDQVATTATGDLTVHGVTNPVTFDLEAQLVDDTIVVVGSTEISFTDFGVTVPSAPIVLSANDFGTIELQLFLVRS